MSTTPSRTGSSTSNVAQDAVAVLGHHDVDADRIAGVALRHTQLEGLTALSGRSTVFGRS